MQESLARQRTSRLTHLPPLVSAAIHPHAKDFAVFFQVVQWVRSARKRNNGKKTHRHKCSRLFVFWCIVYICVYYLVFYVFLFLRYLGIWWDNSQYSLLWRPCGNDQQELMVITHHGHMASCPEPFGVRDLATPPNVWLAIGVHRSIKPQELKKWKKWNKWTT